MDYNFKQVMMICIHGFIMVGFIMFNDPYIAMGYVLVVFLIYVNKLRSLINNTSLYNITLLKDSDGYKNSLFILMVAILVNLIAMMRFDNNITIIMIFLMNIMMTVIEVYDASFLYRYNKDRV